MKKWIHIIASIVTYSIIAILITSIDHNNYFSVGFVIAIAVLGVVIVNISISIDFKKKEEREKEQEERERKERAEQERRERAEQERRERAEQERRERAERERRERAERERREIAEREKKERAEREKRERREKEERERKEKETLQTVKEFLSISSAGKDIVIKLFNSLKEEFDSYEVFTLVCDRCFLSFSTQQQTSFTYFVLKGGLKNYNNQSFGRVLRTEYIRKRNIVYTSEMIDERYKILGSTIDVLPNNDHCVDISADSNNYISQCFFGSILENLGELFIQRYSSFDPDTKYDVVIDGRQKDGEFSSNSQCLPAMSFSLSRKLCLQAVAKNMCEAKAVTILGKFVLGLFREMIGKPEKNESCQTMRITIEMEIHSDCLNSEGETIINGINRGKNRSSLSFEDIGIAPLKRSIDQAGAIIAIASFVQAELMVNYQILRPDVQVIPEANENCSRIVFIYSSNKQDNPIGWK